MTQISSISIEQAITLLGTSFRKTLYYQDDEAFLKRIAGLEEKNRRNVLQFRDWDWIHGVGLYGYWKIYEESGDDSYLEQLRSYYEEHIQKGLPEKNINSVCPMLTMTLLYEHEKRQEWLPLIREWAEWVMKELPRTQEGGFQHVTAESENRGQLWDDTLFMTVLFLAKAGSVLQKEEYVEEAKYQFLLHTKYLCDRASGLWYHGWTFEEGHNFAKALWARGNCWITIAIPLFLEMTGNRNDAVSRFLKETLKRQVQSLIRFQADDGLWHTIIDDPESYTEASGSAGFAFGMLKAVHMGLLSSDVAVSACRAAETLLALIDAEGMVHQVSIGTPMGRTVEFYKEIGLDTMPYGQALMILYLIELQKELNAVQESL